MFSLCVMQCHAVRIIHCVSKNDTDVAHYNFNAHQPVLVIFAEVLLRKYAIKWGFVIPLLLTSVSALHWEHKHEPRKLFFSVMLYTVSRK